MQSNLGKVGKISRQLPFIILDTFQLALFFDRMDAANCHTASELNVGVGFNPVATAGVHNTR